MVNYKFLLYISYSYAIPIGIPLEKEIQKRGYEIKWFTYIPETKKYLPSESILLENVEAMIAYKPDIVLTIADYVPDFITGLKVQVFHGFNPGKRGENDHFNIRGFFDLYCTQGPSTTKRFKLEQKKHPHFEVTETGWSKMDTLFPLPEKKTGNPPVIMITSTFSHRLSLALREEVFEEIKRLAETGKYRFITVLHPKLPEAIMTKWKSLNNNYFTFCDTTDLNPLFKQADIMFSDTTSAIQEFMLTQRPVVTYRHHRPNPCVIDITEPAEIETALNYALTYPAAVIDAISKAAAENHPYTDGKSSERVIDAAIRFLRADKQYLKKKPLNIIRKYKIRKMLRHLTFKSYRKPYTSTKTE